MPVSDITPYLNLAASGGNTYPFTFKIFAASDLVVRVAGVVKTLGLDYMVTITAEPGEGGSVVFQPGYIPAAGSGAVEVERKSPLGRDTDYQEAGGFRQSVVDKDFDRAVMLVQERERRLATAEDDIDNLEDRATTVEGRATTLEGRADAVEERATDLEERAGVAEGNIADLAILHGAPLAPYSQAFKPGDIITRGPWLDARAEPSLAEADAVAAAAGKLLIISTEFVVPVAQTLNAAVKIIPGGSIRVDGALNIFGAFEGCQGCIGGVGTVLYGPGSVEKVNPGWRGAKGDGVTDSRLPVRYSRIDAILSKVPLQFSAGTFLVDSAALNTAGADGVRILGSGARNTILKSYSGDHGIEISADANPASYAKVIEIAYLTIQGAGMADAAADKHGIYIHDLGPYGGPSHIHLHDLEIKGFSGKGVYMPQEWHTTLENVEVDDVKDHHFDLQGGNTTTLIRCYPHKVLTGKAGYRIRGGNVTMIACNGIDCNYLVPELQGAFWGVFGNNVAEDGEVRYFSGTLIGCNVEDFTDTGVFLKDGSNVTLLSTTFYAPAGGIDYVAIFAYASNAIGFLDSSTSFGTKGGTFRNGVAIHTHVGTPPFYRNGISSNSNGDSYYSRQVALVYPIPYIGARAHGYRGAGIKISKLETPALAQTTATPAFGAQITVDPNAAGLFNVVATSNIPFAINNPVSDPGALAGQRLTIRVKNSSGGNLGVITWGGNYKFATPWINPADGAAKSVEFVYINGADLWQEINRSGKGRGTNTNDDALAGEVGEIVSSLVASGAAAALATNVGLNVTSISLTAGDWDVAGNVNLTAAAATITAMSAGISSASATVPTDGSEVYNGQQSAAASFTTSLTMPRKRISLSATTTIYLVAKTTFSAGAVSAFGAIAARRVR